MELFKKMEWASKPYQHHSKKKCFVWHFLFVSWLSTLVFVFWKRNKEREKDTYLDSMWVSGGIGNIMGEGKSDDSKVEKKEKKRIYFHCNFFVF